MEQTNANAVMHQQRGENNDVLPTTPKKTRFQTVKYPRKQMNYTKNNNITEEIKL